MCSLIFFCKQLRKFCVERTASRFIKKLSCFEVTFFMTGGSVLTLEAILKYVVRDCSWCRCFAGPAVGLVL
jgi:hypothetical protein